MVGSALLALGSLLKSGIPGHTAENENYDYAWRIYVGFFMVGMFQLDLCLFAIFS